MANDLTLRPGNLPTTPSLPASVKPLLAGFNQRSQWSPDGKEYVGTVEDWKVPATITDEQRADCRAALVDLEKHLMAASVEHIGARVLGALSHHYVPGMSAQVQSIVASDWLEDLEEFPAWAVDEAFRAWRRMEDKKPNIAGIRDLCLRAVRKDRQARDRLRTILETHGTKPQSPPSNIITMPTLRRMGD